MTGLLMLALEVYVFVVGCCVGSFLNVVIARVPRQQSIVRPRSRCPTCGIPIPWSDNLPILSWIWLRGRCRACQTAISPRYPTVELLGGALALAVFHRDGLHAALPAHFAFCAVLVALAYIDLDTWLLPSSLTYPLIAVGLLSALWEPGLRWFEPLLGAACGGLLLAAVAWTGDRLGREWMGWGDVFLLAGLGAWLGIRSLLPVLLLSSLQGALVGGAALWLKSKRAPQAPPETPLSEPAGAATDLAADREVEADWTPPAHAVPFGPFLALAGLEQLFFGDALTDWFVHAVTHLTMSR